MANSLQNAVAGASNPTAIIGADKIGAVIRTSLSKSGSSNSIKNGNAPYVPSLSTKDENAIDELRGERYDLQSLVLIHGQVAIDTNQQNVPERLDRIKLLGEAVMEIIRNEGILSKDSIAKGMSQLWSLYQGKRTLKQPTSEQFDEMIGDAFTTTHRDAMLTPVGFTSKKGNFVVRDLQFKIVSASVGNANRHEAIDSLSAEDRVIFNALSNSVATVPVGNMLAPKTADSSVPCPTCGRVKAVAAAKKVRKRA
jgi:hypothetical protein